MNKMILKENKMRKPTLKILGMKKISIAITKIV